LKVTTPSTMDIPPTATWSNLSRHVREVFDMHTSSCLSVRHSASHAGIVCLWPYLRLWPSLDPTLRSISSGSTIDRPFKANSSLASVFFILEQQQLSVVKTCTYFGTQLLRHRATDRRIQMIDQVGSCRTSHSTQSYISRFDRCRGRLISHGQATLASIFRFLHDDFS
jgi:hypothetical protein